MDSQCAKCSQALARGTVAVWDRQSRNVYCLSCAAGSRSSEAPALEPGIAGGSGRREYERRKQKDEARLPERWGRLGDLAVALSKERQSTRAWDLGALGEEKLGSALEGLPDVRVLHDRRVKGTKANIDHLFVAPAGVFVVDAKNYLGTIRIRDRGGLFRTVNRLYVGRRDCSHLADGMSWQVEAVKLALAAAGLDPLPSVTPVLCFVDGDWPLLFPPTEYKGVRLEGLKSLRKLLAAGENLDDTAIGAVHRALAAALSPK